MNSDDDEWWLSRLQIRQARARNIFKNIVLETKTLPFSQWRCMPSHSDTCSCLSGTEVHKAHHSNGATSSKETKTEKINYLLP